MFDKKVSLLSALVGEMKLASRCNGNYSKSRKFIHDFKEKLENKRHSSISNNNICVYLIGSTTVVFGKNVI
jgi:hypothetical protein